VRAPARKTLKMYTALTLRTSSVLVTIDKKQEMAAAVEGVTTAPITTFIP
jgi:hypothetical protein